MSDKINPKKWVEENRNKFDSVLGKTVRLTLDTINIATEARLYAIIPVRLSDVVNAPEKRPLEDGKMYTPPCFQLVFDQGNLIFAIEDTTILVTMRGGVELIIGQAHVTVEAAYENN